MKSSTDTNGGVKKESSGQRNGGGGGKGGGTERLEERIEATEGTKKAWVVARKIAEGEKM